MESTRLDAEEGADDDRPSMVGSIDVDFTQFYEREHAGQVRRAALLLGSDDAANDVVHDALAAVYQRWSSIDDPGPYLNRAVLNGCRDVGRRAVRDRRTNRRLHTVAGAEPADPLFDVLASLPFNQRAAVVLRFYVGMTEREIAVALGASPGSVGPWINRALAKMRKELS
jgi:RNA polymerase sigma factor (sigma-70 family)